MVMSIPFLNIFYFGVIDMVNLATRLIELKEKNNVLQKDIAKSVGLSLRSYQRYEYGERNPTSDILIKLADYFDVSLDYLVGRSDDPKRY
mgnify:CR=1 FL=1